MCPVTPNDPRPRETLHPSLSASGQKILRYEIYPPICRCIVQVYLPHRETLRVFPRRTREGCDQPALSILARERRNAGGSVNGDTFLVRLVLVRVRILLTDIRDVAPRHRATPELWSRFRVSWNSYGTLHPRLRYRSQTRLCWYRIKRQPLLQLAEAVSQDTANRRIVTAIHLVRTNHYYSVPASHLRLSSRQWRY